MAKGRKSHIVIWVSDTHAGSRWAVCPPEVTIDLGGEEPSLYQANKIQTAIHGDWLDFIEKCKERSKGKRPILILGGDLVDGPHHHNSQETFGSLDDQKAIAVELLLPLATMADEIYGLRGTRGHVGELAQADADVAKELGAISTYNFLDLEVDGRLVNARHHFSTSRKPAMRGNSHRALAKDEVLECLERETRRPDVMLRGHVHLAVKEYLAQYNMWIASSGGWQLGTYYTSGLSREVQDIGGAIYDPALHEVELINYKPQRTILRAKE